MKGSTASWKLWIGGILVGIGTVAMMASMAAQARPENNSPATSAASQSLPPECAADVARPCKTDAVERQSDVQERHVISPNVAWTDCVQLPGKKHDTDAASDLGIMVCHAIIKKAERK